jgi:hypothetical protein
MVRTARICPYLPLCPSVYQETTLVEVGKKDIGGRFGVWTSIASSRFSPAVIRRGGRIVVSKQERTKTVRCCVHDNGADECSLRIQFQEFVEDKCFHERNKGFANRYVPYIQVPWQDKPEIREGQCSTECSDTDDSCYWKIVLVEKIPDEYDQNWYLDDPSCNKRKKELGFNDHANIRLRGNSGDCSTGTQPVYPRYGESTMNFPWSSRVLARD